MRPRDMTIQQHGKGMRISFENSTELVVINASAARLHEWARQITAVTATVMKQAGDPTRGAPGQDSSALPAGHPDTGTR